ncbi:MAG: hypothetical protein HGA38_00395 [Candidatus Moranbacteria bacterium]|nr:hypothetical protein [Candidatus Moranbacteria bacterium]HWQ59875.1 hypothetical protein [Candidatus Fimivivens sp.]
MEYKVNIALVCDYAFTGDAGKLNVIGVFKNINLQKSGDEVPVHRQMFVVTNISVPSEKQYTQKISLVNKDTGGVILDLPPVIAGVEKSPTGSVDLGMILQLNDTKFEVSGNYAVDIEINGEKIEEIPIIVKVS